MGTMLLKGDFLIATRWKPLSSLNGPGMIGGVSSGAQQLTPRQKEILRLLFAGHNAKSAARELGISVHTVNEHLRDARRSMEVSSSREAARILVESEERPLNPLGPSGLGVHSGKLKGRRSDLRKSNPSLAYAGGTLMLFGIIMAVELLRSHAPASVRPLLSAQAERNPSPYKIRDLAPGRFDQITVSGPFKVGVIVGQRSHVTLQGPPALLADTIVANEGGTLTIRFREGADWSWNPGSGMNVVVFTPTLGRVHVEGAGDVEIDGVRGNSFAAVTDGSGSISIRGMDVGAVQLATAGAGGITAEGAAKNATYVVGGSGSIDAMRTQAKDATIAINGAGNAFSDVSGTANIAITGGGRVQVVGGGKCVTLPTNSPRVNCR